MEHVPDGVGSSLCVACMPGKYNDATEVYVEGLRRCIECPLGWVQPFANQSSCKECSQDGSVNCADTRRIFVEQGYYIPVLDVDRAEPNRFTFSILASRCSQSSACLAGWLPLEPSVNASVSFSASATPARRRRLDLADGTGSIDLGGNLTGLAAGEQDARCAVGHTGPLCGTCVSGYYTTILGCEECPGPHGTTVLSVTYLTLGVLVMTVLVIHLAGGAHAIFSPRLYDALEQKAIKYPLLTSVATRPVGAYLRVMVALLKISICFGQCTLSFLRFYQAEWPPSLSAFFERFALFSNFNVLDARLLECYSDDYYYYTTLRLALLLPIMLFLLLLLLLGVGRAIANLTGAAALYPPLTNVKVEGLEEATRLPWAPRTAKTRRRLRWAKQAAFRWTVGALMRRCSGRISRCLASSHCVLLLRNGGSVAWNSIQLWNSSIFLLLLLYPSLCVASLSIFDTAELCVHVYEPGTGLESIECTRYLSADTSLLYDDNDAWYRSAVLCVLAIAIYVVGVPLFFWIAISSYSSARQPTSLRDRVWLLTSSYKTGYKHFAVFECARILALTGVILHVAKGSVIQLWFGMICSVTFLAVYRMRPYRDFTSNFVQMLFMSNIALLYLTSCLFLSSFALTLTFSAPPGDSSAEHWGVAIVVAETCALAVVVVLFVFAMRGSSREKSGLKLCYVSDGNPVQLLPPHAGAVGFHCFLSHVWKYGQDQVATMKSMMTTMVPEAKIFLVRSSLLWNRTPLPAARNGMLTDGPLPPCARAGR